VPLARKRVLHSGLSHRSDRVHSSMPSRFAPRQRRRVEIPRPVPEPGFCLWCLFLDGTTSHSTDPSSNGSACARACSGQCIRQRRRPDDVLDRGVRHRARQNRGRHRPELSGPVKGMFRAMKRAVVHRRPAVGGGVVVCAYGNDSPLPRVVAVRGARTPYT
jgi:hypothetical protein